MTMSPGREERVTAVLEIAAVSGLLVGVILFFITKL